MAIRDLELFLQERARSFDENLDVSKGSPFDTKVMQPLVRRMGNDPFSVDLAVFLHERLRQAFPELATEEGDAITDLLIKPATLLWDSIVREISIARSGRSFNDPSVLTTEEVDALGANLFSERNKGDRSRGLVRLYFAQPRSLSVTPINFVTSKGGLHFVPDGTQHITLEEMLLNFEPSSNLYFFDINALAERTGSEYDIGPHEILTIANVESVTKITNPRRFRGGSDEEGAVDFVDRTREELTERSLVTVRGIGAQVPRAFPEVSRLAVVGFGDPEMGRDVLRGGGLGAILAAGNNLNGELDGENRSLTRRLRLQPSSGVDFVELIGPPGRSAPSGRILTLFGAFGGAPPFARDLNVTRVVAHDMIEVEAQVINPFARNIHWTLRKSELTLSSIPGGILFPDSPNGTITLSHDAVHVGGATDILVRGKTLDESSLVIENLQDEQPAAEGNKLVLALGFVSLNDFVFGRDYAAGDKLYVTFQSAKERGLTLQIVDGPHAGSYRVLEVVQLLGASPVIALDATLAATPGEFRWRIVDVIELDLVEPKEFRCSGSDLETVQNLDTVQTSSATDFMASGVSPNDRVQIRNGPDAGEFTVRSVVAFNRLRLDRPLTASATGLQFVVFRPNPSGGLKLPLVRVTRIELLDTTKQPLGTPIPYARPVDVRSRAFQNPGRGGVKVLVRDAELGIVTLPAPSGGFVLDGQELEFHFPGATLPLLIVRFSGTLTAPEVVAQINASASAVLGPSARVATLVGSDRIGIVPIARLVMVTDGTARATLFGSDELRTSADIRSATITEQGGWKSVGPAINQDGLDVVSVLDGINVGFHGTLRLSAGVLGPSYSALFAGDPDSPDFAPCASFSPQVGRSVQIGARSIGSVRCFFLEPTSIEFDDRSSFTVHRDGGFELKFLPDPTFESVRIPPPPSTVLPKDGTSRDGERFSVTGSTHNFVRSSIRPGDVLELLFVPIVGRVELSDPVPGAALEQLVISLEGGARQTVTFRGDLSGSPGDVSRASLIDQINGAVGRRIAKLSADDRLELESDVPIVVAGTGSANELLGLAASDQSNRSPHAGRYRIMAVAPGELTVSDSFPVTAQSMVERQAFRILRRGAQRICSTEMNQNRTNAGFYYFDVELVSEGSGDLWNLVEGLRLNARDFVSDGYFLTTTDENLAFSSAERPKLHLSRSMLEVGAGDDPQNAIQLTGQNIEISYERSELVSDVHDFVASDAERVVCSSPLARHLIPHCVRFDMNYSGGSAPEIVRRDLESHIQRLFPSDALESSDLQAIAYRRGATSVTNPLELIAVVHHQDRTISVERSHDFLRTGRLAAFIPEILNLRRQAS